MHFLVDGPERAERTLVFAHGAGGAMDTAFMTAMAAAIAAHEIRVVRFEFPYMAARRVGKKSGAPDRQPVLLQTFREAVTEIGAAAGVVVGGKSLGGRMASLIADEIGAAGLVCFGYPFHPPGAVETLRTAHLAGLRTPTLILQGERDPFGTREEVGAYSLSSAIRVEWIADGDHSFKPRVRSGTTSEANLTRAAGLAVDFIRGVREKPRPGRGPLS